MDKELFLPTVTMCVCEMFLYYKFLTDVFNELDLRNINTHF